VSIIGGVILLNTTYKVFSKILYLRLLPYAERAIGSYQCGFRQGKSSIDQIYTLRQILEKTAEYNIENHHCDFSTACDSINKAQLYITMQELQFPDKLIRLVKATMENSQCQVKIQADMSDPLITTSGLRQGDSLACLLFNIALEKVIIDKRHNIS
jgi:sorting nexin-29